MRRREFITLVGAAIAWPIAARAQQPKVPTIGALVIGNISPEEFWREFRQGLRDLGYIDVFVHAVFFGFRLCWPQRHEHERGVDG